MDLIQYVKDMFLALKCELLNHRSWVAVTFSLILGVGVLVALNWPKYYVAKAVIVKDVTNVIEPLLRGAAQVSNIDAKEKVQDIIFSRRVLEKVLLKIDDSIHSYSPEELAVALNALQVGLTVIENKYSTNLTQVMFRSSSPDKAYKTLDAVVTVFIEEKMADKQRKSHDAHDFISNQVDKYKKRLGQAENKLKEFKESSLDDTELAVRSRISSLTEEIQNLNLSISESEETLRTTKKQLEEEGVTIGGRRKLNTLEERYTALTGRLAQLQLLYQDSYPDVVTIRGQIADLDDEIRLVKLQYSLTGAPTSELPLFEELRKQISFAEVTLRNQKRRLAALDILLKKEYSLADQLAAKQAELTELSRDYSVTKDLYEKMLGRKENAKLTLDLNDQGQGESYRLIEPPVYPLYSSGIRALYIFLAAPFIAFLVPLGAALAYIVLDPRFRSKTLLKAKLPKGVVLLAEIPHRGTPLGTKLLRKDIFLLIVLCLFLIGAYGYSLYYFFGQL